MAQAADRIGALPKQFFANLVGRVQSRLASGHDVINLGQGNPDLPTPAHIVAALQEAVLDPTTHRYPPFSGLSELKEAVAHFYRETYGVHLDAFREVAILPGGKTGLVELSEIYLNQGDVALVPNPGYPDYWSGVALAGGRMEMMPLCDTNNYLPDYNLISQKIRDEAKLMFLNYPNNPTGAIATKAFFSETVAFAKQSDILVVHDFAYGAFGFDDVVPPSFLQSEGAKDIGVEIYTMSKTYNMAGWRIAFAVGNADVIAKINLLQDHYYVSVFSAVQRAAIAALNSSQACVETLRKTYETRRNAFMDGLTASHGELQYTKPGGSFFCWLPVPKSLTSQSFADYLLEKANVAVAPGIGFGHCGEGYVRVGLLTNEQRLGEAAKRIVKAVDELM